MLEPGEQALDEPVELVTLNDVALAQVMRSVLVAAGIPALLFNLGFAGLLGGGYPGIRVMVGARDAANARRLLELPAE